MWAAVYVAPVAFNALVSIEPPKTILSNKNSEKGMRTGSAACGSDYFDIALIQTGKPLIPSQQHIPTRQHNPCNQQIILINHRPLPPQPPKKQRRLLSRRLIKRANLNRREKLFCNLPLQYITSLSAHTRLWLWF